MNKELSEAIAYHILSSFGVLPSTFIDWDKTGSLVDKRFVLSEKLSFHQNDQTTTKNIYGCQFKTPDAKNFKILLGDCSIDSGFEYCLIAQLEGSPTYGIYLLFDEADKELDSEVMIAVSTDNKNWIICTTYLQATFLAGMERIKELVMACEKCTDYQSQYKMLLSFIDFHNNYYYEDADEGQEV